MVQPPPPNPDNDLPPQQTGVQQNISDGSSNQGSMQGANAGRDSNQIHGDANQISQTQNFFITLGKTRSALTPRSGKAPQFWHTCLGALVSLSLISVLGGILFSIPQIREELAIGESICYAVARKEGKRVIAVAKFHNEVGSSSITPLIRNKIIEELTRPTLRNFSVCRTDKSVLLPDEAQKLGTKLKAAVVIWGSQDGSILTVKVTAAEINVSHLTTDFAKQTEDWPYLVSVMTAFQLSKIYEKEGRSVEALETLLQALSFEESMDLNFQDKDTIKVLSKAHYFLGDIYAPKEDWGCSNIRTNCEAALRAYQRAFDFNQTFYEALRSKGILYQRLGKLSEAKDAYTQVIEYAPENQSELKLMARVNRAKIYLKQQEAMKAVKDLEFVCQQHPHNIVYLRFLGSAQLQAKQIKPATKTYKDVMRFLNLDKAAQAEILDDLQSLAKERQDLRSDIDTIIATLKN